MAHIITDFYKTDNQSIESISEIERVLGGYVKAIGKENCSEAIKYDCREEIKFHLGEERRTTISWYPFKEKSVILEVGGEFGAITGELCDRAQQVIVTESSLFRANIIAERYKDRDNLYIYIGKVEEIKFSCLFDYIVITDIVDKVGKQTTKNEEYIRFFSDLSSYLKLDGKYLLATDNLYSIANCQNVDGALNPWTHIRKLHKNQIETIMKEAGFPHFRFYYPLPSYHLVGRVYTNDNLPTALEWNCLLNYSCADQNQLAVNMDLLQKLTDNGMFPFFAPAFFVEAGREDNLLEIGKVNVLFDENLELPMLGFDWAKHGYNSLAETVQFYREKQIQPYREIQNKTSILKIDQDNKVISSVQEIELDLLRKLQAVCDKYNLKLYGMYGTLLGAVRNAGIIPGDDDIDVALMREDYDKLLTLGHEFTGNYFLQTPENDNCFYGGYLKLRNVKTSAIHPLNWWVDCCEGICIDIFPLDYGFSSKTKEIRKRKKIKFLQRLLYAKAYGYFPRFREMKMLEWKAHKYMGKVFSQKQLSDMLTRVMASGDNVKGAPFGVYAHYMGTRGPRLVDRSAFDDECLLAYEDLLLRVPAGWHFVLSSLYGTSYMEPKPWIEGKWRHGFYSTEESYYVYKKRFRDLFRPMPAANQKIVLFGDGYVFKVYFERYKEQQYKPSHIVALYGKNVVNNVCGIEVQSIEDIGFIPKEEIYPIICSVDIRAAERKMKQVGFSDYFIFLGAREWMLYANPTTILRGLGTE